MTKGLVITVDEHLINVILDNKLNQHIRFSLSTNIFQGAKILSNKKFDILIIDLESSTWNINQAIEITKKLNSRLHIIVVAGVEFQKNKTILDRNSIDFLLFKPIEVENLNHHLSLLLTRKDRLSSPVYTRSAEKLHPWEIPIEKIPEN